MTRGLETGAAWVDDIYTDLIFYGDQVLDGAWATGTFCSIIDECVREQDFFFVTSAAPGFQEPIDGVLGLARPDQPFYIDENDTAYLWGDKENFLTKLDLPLKMFSTRLQKYYVSWIDFGAPDPRDVTSKPVKLTVLDDYFWSLSN